MENMSEEEIQKLIEAGVVPDKNALLAKQLEYQQALRRAPGPEGRTVRGIYQAANPLEHVGNFLQKRDAQQQMGNIQGQVQQNQKAQTDARTQYLMQILRNRGAAPMQQRPMAPQIGTPSYEPI